MDKRARCTSGSNLTAHSDSLTRIRCQKCCSYGDNMTPFVQIFIARAHCVRLYLPGLPEVGKTKFVIVNIRGENFDIARPQAPNRTYIVSHAAPKVRLRAVALSSHLSQLSLPSLRGSLVNRVSVLLAEVKAECLRLSIAVTRCDLVLSRGFKLGT